MIDAVVYYSNTGQSKSVASYLAKKLGFTVMNMEQCKENNFHNLVLVFPVHCQNIPFAVKGFLKAVKINFLTVIATYGKMCYGNVLYEIQKKFCFTIIAAAYVPCSHAYLDEEYTIDFEQLLPLVEKIKQPTQIQLPKLYKNIFADFFPRLRSRIGLKIYKNSSCNSCGICNEHCYLHAIKNGVVNSNCIRCTKCVSLCPSKALGFKARLPLRIYLRKKQISKTIIYT